jgi:hypothetical protein
MANIILRSGKTKNENMPVTPSQVFVADSLVKYSSGKIVPCVAGDAAIDVVGIIRKAIATTDSDYASDREVPIEVPAEKHCLYEMEVGTGTIAATDRGAEFDLAGPTTVDQSATTDKVVKLKKFISTTKGVFYIKFNGSY